MHLIGPLAAGIRGAESGHVEIYERGTSTRATYYTDFEGYQINGTGTNIRLDAYGGTEVYVNEYVDVRVFDSVGTLVREFTAGDSSPNIECRSGAFSGTDYATGQTGTSWPASLQQILDRWTTSAGAADWYVNVGGVNVTIQNALGAVGGVFINVKDPTYGAIGDGVTDDTASIQAAFDYAVSVPLGTQRIVFFPPGEYLTTGLNLPGGVCIWGSGPSSTVIITNDAADNDLITTSSNPPATWSAQYIADISFSHYQASAGRLIVINRAAVIHFSRCYFAGAYCTDNVIEYEAGSAADAILMFRDCAFTVGDATNNALALDAAPMQVDMKGCIFGTSAAYSGTVLVDAWNSTIAECLFYNTFALTPAAYTCIHQKGDMISVGNRFTVGGNLAVITVYSLIAHTCLPGTLFHEYANCYPTNVSAALFRVYENTIVYTSGGINISRSSLSEREATVAYLVSNTTPVALDTAEHGVYVITHTNNAIKTITDAQAGEHIPGQRFTLIIHQTTVAGGAITIGAGFIGGHSGFSTTQDCYEVQHYVAVETSANTCSWVLVSWHEDVPWL